MKAFLQVSGFILFVCLHVSGVAQVKVIQAEPVISKQVKVSGHL